MNERPTPETDAAKWVEEIGEERCEYVPASFAEKLERERDEAREEVERLRAAIERTYGRTGMRDNPQ